MTVTSEDGRIGSGAMAGRRRTLIQSAALAATLLAAVWVLVLAATGGFSLMFAGVTLRSHDMVRPLVGGSLSLAVFVWATGVARTALLWSRAVARADHRVVATALAVAAFAVGAGYATTVANASDAYGYVSEADLWLGGNVRQAQPWVTAAPWPSPESSFAPLAYRPAGAGTKTDIVPVYAPGLPLLMAAAHWLGGFCATFLVMPIAGAVLVLATCGVGSRLGSPGAGLIAGWFVLTSPTYLFMLVVPMSDVTGAACWAVAFYYLLRPGRISAVAAGSAAGLAILIRPNLFWLAAAPGVWLLWNAWSERGGARARSVARLVGFAVPVAAAATFLAFLFARLYGSPFDSGYGPLSVLFSWSNIGVNLRQYFGWLIDTQTPLVIIGLAAIAWPARALWPGAADRGFFWAVGAFVAGLWIFYFFYLPFDAWWFLRFHLPTWPFIMLGLAAVLVALARRSPIHLIACMWLVVALGVWAVNDARARGAFGLWRADRNYVAAAQATREATPPTSVVFADLHSGTVRYYGGRMSLRFVLLDEHWLDRAVAWMREHGSASYALLERAEVAEFKSRFAGSEIATRLDAPPIFEIAETGLALYALSDPFDGVTRKLTPDPAALKCVRPIELPAFGFQ